MTATREPASSGRPRVAVLGMGGTIAFVGAGPFDVVDYGETGHLIGVLELLERMPEVAELAEFVASDVAQVGSEEVSPSTWLELRSAVVRALSDNDSLAGVVITHGTATLEETAYFLHLTLPTRRPVVLVGAQRPPTALSSDAQMNLAASVRLASSELAAELGVIVVMNDEVHCARDATKARVSRLDAFKSSDLGPLGQVEGDGSIALYRSPLRLHTVRSRFARPGYLDGVTELPSVDIAYSYAGSEGRAVRAAIEAGARAVVVAALPPGLVTPGEARAIEDALSAGVRVILATRAGGGRVLRRRADCQIGVVTADDLSPQKARVLAMLALLRTNDPEELQQLYSTY